MRPAKSVWRPSLRQQRIDNAIPATETVCANDETKTGFYNRFQIVVQIEKRGVEIDQYRTDKTGAVGNSGASEQDVRVQQVGRFKILNAKFAGSNQALSKMPALRFFCTLFHSKTWPFIAT